MSTPKITRSSAMRWALLAAGSLCLALGLVGMVLPLLPTTPFLLLAAACYVRSSERMYRWLLENKTFGPYLRGYLERRGVPLGIKVRAISMLWLAIGLSAVFAVEQLWARLLLLAIALAVTVHLVLIKTPPAEQLRAELEASRDQV